MFMRCFRFHNRANNRTGKANNSPLAQYLTPIESDVQKNKTTVIHPLDTNSIPLLYEEMKQPLWISFGSGLYGWSVQHNCTC